MCNFQMNLVGWLRVMLIKMFHSIKIKFQYRIHFWPNPLICTRQFGPTTPCWFGIESFSSLFFFLVTYRVFDIYRYRNFSGIGTRCLYISCKYEIDLESAVQCRLIAILIMLNDVPCNRAMQIIFRRPAQTTAATVKKIQPILKLSISSLHIHFIEPIIYADSVPAPRLVQNVIKSRNLPVTKCIFI